LAGALDVARQNRAGEQAVVMMWTGSSGLFLPTDISPLGRSIASANIRASYGCFCHQLSIVTPNNGMYFGCASLLE
jgi:hypothetical protein